MPSKHNKGLVQRAGEAATLTVVGIAAAAAGANQQPDKAEQPNPAKVAPKDIDVAKKVQAIIGKIEDHLENTGKPKPEDAVTEAAINAKIKAMGSGSYPEREKARMALEKWGFQTKPQIVNALKNSDLEIKRRAERILETFGPVDDLRAEKLKPLVEQLGNCKADAEPAVTVLRKVLKEANAPLVQAGLNALGMIGPGAEEAVPDVIDRLKYGNPGTKAAAATALGRMGRGATGAMDALIVSIKDADPTVAQEAAFAIGRIGPPESQRAVPALIDAANDFFNVSKRRGAITSLGGVAHIYPKKIIPELIGHFADETPGIKRVVAKAFLEFAKHPNPEAKKEAKDVVDTLIPAIMNWDTMLVRDAVTTLELMGPLAKEAVGPLRKFQKSSLYNWDLLPPLFGLGANFTAGEVTERVILRQQAGKAADAIEKSLKENRKPKLEPRESFHRKLEEPFESHRQHVIRESREPSSNLKSKG